MSVDYINGLDSLSDMDTDDLTKMDKENISYIYKDNFEFDDDHTELTEYPKLKFLWKHPANFIPSRKCRTLRLPWILRYSSEWVAPRWMKQARKINSNSLSSQRFWNTRTGGWHFRFLCAVFIWAGRFSKLCTKLYSGDQNTTGCRLLEGL